MASTCRPDAAVAVSIARCATISSTVTASLCRKRRSRTCSDRLSASPRMQTSCRSLTRSANNAPFFLSRSSPKYPIPISAIARPRFATAHTESCQIRSTQMENPLANRIAPQQNNSHCNICAQNSPEGRGETEQRSNRATRFRPGQSGNPRGRPKRARGLAALVDRVLDEKVEATENGKSRRMTKRVAAMKQLVNRAVKGDHRATQLVVALIRDDQGPPAPPAPEQLGEADAMVVAELVRRIRSSAP